MCARARRRYCGVCACSHQYLVASERGKTCDKTCEDEDLSCEQSSADFGKINNCDALKQVCARPSLYSLPVPLSLSLFPAFSALPSLCPASSLDPPLRAHPPFPCPPFNSFFRFTVCWCNHATVFGLACPPFAPFSLLLSLVLSFYVCVSVFASVLRSLYVYICLWRCLCQSA